MPLATISKLLMLPLHFKELCLVNLQSTWIVKYAKDLKITATDTGSPQGSGILF